MRGVFSFLSVLAILASIPIHSTVEAGGLHKRGLVVCKNLLINKPKWQKGHYAFAISEAGQHCGWSFGQKKRIYAYHQALRTCKRRAHTPCRVVYAK